MKSAMVVLTGIPLVVMVLFTERVRSDVIVTWCALVLVSLILTRMDRSTKP